VNSSNFDSATAVGGAGASAPAPPTAELATRPRRRRLRRASVPTLAMTPFIFFTFLGLGVPVLAVIDHAFRSKHGQLTTANVRLVSHGVYLLGFENSIKLSLITSILPGILGVFLAYAILTSSNGWLRRLVTTASGVLANFGGINLTFMFIASLGSTGVLTVWLKSVHLDPWNFGFNLYTFYGVAFVYMYFQIPLMVLVITPALGGLRASWREAAQNMGASNWQYWRHVGVPVLLPSILGGMLLLFGSAFAAYATAQSLTGGIIALSPIQIGNLMNGNVLSGQVNVGYAIGLGMLVVLTVTMVLYGLVRRRASKWLQ
jgi:putative spermidine/putrescine transport system permease protein